MPEAPAAPRARKFRGQVFIHWDRCKGCGFCMEFCPPKALAFCAEFNEHGYHPPYLADEEACTGCGRCMEVCPPRAIIMRDGSAGVEEDFCEECGFCAAECKVKAIAIPFPRGSDP